MINLQRQKRQPSVGYWLLGASGAIALLAITGVGMTWRGLRAASDPIPVQMIEVERRSIEVTINESGTVELGNQQTLTSPSEGAVERVFVEPGDRVTAGQTLITLRNPERQTALATQQLNIQQEQARLERNRQRVLEAQEQLAADQEELTNMESLAEAGAIAQTEVQDQANAVRQSRAALRDAESEVEQSGLALKELQLELQRIERELEDTIISAPMAGVILGVNVKDGDGVEIRTELLTIGDSTSELVELELSTLNATQVRPNQRARVSVIGPDPQIFMGTVVGLYPQAVPSGAGGQESGSESGQPRVPTLVRLDQPTQVLIPGGQVNVEIIIEQREDALALNVEALQQMEDGTFVWMMDETGKARKQPVSVGLEALTEVEVVDGLEDGQKVILPPLDTPLEVNVPVVEDDSAGESEPNSPGLNE